MITLSQYITEKSPQVVAKEIKVSVQTVYNWRNMACYPTRTQAKRLIKKSRLLTWHSIYEPEVKR